MARNTTREDSAPVDAAPTDMDGQEMPADGRGKNSNRYDVTDLRNITSFADAAALVKRTLGDDALVDASEVLGTGFTVLPTNDKQRLVGVDFIILSVDFNMGDNGVFCSMMIVTKNGERLIVNDGSTGICAQLQDWSIREADPVGGLYVRGLRRSDYKYTDESSGQEKSATTFYLNA